MESRVRLRLYIALIGGFTCVLVAAAFLVPWIGIDYFTNGDFSFRTEYSLGFREYPGLEDMSYLMSGLTIMMVLSFVASVNATILFWFGRTESGMIVSAVSAGLLAASATIFYIGVIEAGPLDHFMGYTLLNRTVSVETAPMIGFWILIAAIASQGTQIATQACLKKK